MRWFLRLCFVVVLLPLTCMGGDNAKLAYPPARVAEQVDVYHGVPVSDPYRWLEDSDSAETQEWIQAERGLTEQYLSQVPEREQIRGRLTELWDYEKRSLPYHRGKNWFFTRNTGLQNHSVLYVACSLDDLQPKVVIDPNTLSPDGS